MRMQQFEHLGAVEWRLAGDDMVKESAQRVEIGAQVGLTRDPSGLFGCNVSRIALWLSEALRSGHRLAGPQSEREIAYFGLERAQIEPDAIGIEVLVNDLGPVQPIE